MTNAEMREAQGHPLWPDFQKAWAGPPYPHTPDLDMGDAWRFFLVGAKASREYEVRANNPKKEWHESWDSGQGG
jgi:hypothetical protein